MGILIRNNIINQKGNPAWYEDTLAARPIANLQGRMFVDTDNPSTGIYRDTGSTWINVADPGAGTTGTLQQVTTNGNTTNKGISITSIGLNTNLINITDQALSSQASYIGQTMGNSDFWKIFAFASVSDQSELVFQVGDNGSPFNPTGQRFRFNYDASGLGTAKDVLIVDYNLSYFNTNLGINTDTPGTPLDVHGTTGVIAQLENTTTQNTLLSFRNQGAGVWSVGNNYNAGANDYIIYDAVSFVNRFTIKSTGQTFIGADTTSSGLLVVNSATSDNHIVCIGANAPSIRLRNTGSSPTLNAGIGISTATNNFIQGSASGNYCIFNSSTTASPILFGVYNAGASQTQEVARISAAQNFLIGTTTDTYKLNVNGTGNFSSVLSSLSLYIPSTTFGSIPTPSYQTIVKYGQNNTFAQIQGGNLNNDNFSTFLKFTTNATTSNTPLDCLILDNTGLATFNYPVNIGNSVAVGVAVASTHKVTIKIGGVQYYLLASNI